MSSLNRVLILGRLGKDPEIRQTQGGQTVATLSIAPDESYTDKAGQKVEQTEWHRVVAWGKTAENCVQYLAKGSHVLVEGKLQTRKWQDQQGQDRYTTEIQAQRVQFIGKKPEGGQGGHEPARQTPPEQPHQRQAPDVSDDIPF